MKKILLAPNSFKECAHSVKVANLLEKYLQESFKCEITKKPISDGGDGFLEVCNSLFNLRMLNAFVSTPYDNSKFEIRYGYDIKKKRIFIESAEVAGLRRIPLEQRHPLSLNTKGLGELLKTIDESGLDVEKLVIGIGGTGTNDMGLGLCSVFGLELLDHSNKKLEIIPANYNKVSKIYWSKPALKFGIEVIMDVDNPLMGSTGSAHTFALQKGATESEIVTLESGFTNLLKILGYNNLDSMTETLNGAGGGLAAGFQLFFNAPGIKAEEFIMNEILSGIDFKEFDYIITGEGAFDDQSLRKKGASIIIDEAISNGRKVILVCGRIEKSALRGYRDNVIPVELSSFFDSPGESIISFEKGLKLAAEKIKDYLAA